MSARLSFNLTNSYSNAFILNLKLPFSSSTCYNFPVIIATSFNDLSSIALLLNSRFLYFSFKLEKYGNAITLFGVDLFNCSILLVISAAPFSKSKISPYVDEFNISFILVVTSNSVSFFESDYI